MTHKIIPVNGNAKDITGQTFGRLTAIAPVAKSKHGGIKWLCICCCGTETVVIARCLISGNTRSCGCLNDELAAERKTTHNFCKLPEYKVWKAMIQRCTNPKNKAFHNYGGRGISIALEWLGFIVFWDDMGARPTPFHTLERIDNDGDYTPENCRWATWKDQQRNRRNNRLMKYRGETRCVAEWAEITGINHTTIEGRLSRNWPVEKVLTQPVNRSC